VFPWWALRAVQAEHTDRRARQTAVPRKTRCAPRCRTALPYNEPADYFLLRALSCCASHSEGVR